MKLFKKSLLSKIQSREFTFPEIRDMLHTISIHDLRSIGKAIVYADYDGYNSNDKYGEMIYFDNLDRWQKEIYVDQRLYKLF